MSSTKIQFTNRENVILSGKLELPEHMKPHNFVLFAHCFTCNKNLSAVRNICRKMTESGFGVLRFDFTGLGESEGEFGDSDFASNISGLIAAANFLKEKYMAPSVLIGHSLGGTATILAAKEIPSIKAVATIGAPSSPVHVRKLIEDNRAGNAESDEILTNIGGRPFTIKKAFIEALDNWEMEKELGSFNKSLLLLHSPQDSIVAIENAAKLYENAVHPKSFVSLDGADHLLSDKKDGEYVGTVIAGWATRYVEISEAKKISTAHQVVAYLGNEGYSTSILAGKHLLTADEPESVGGNDFGPSPYAYVSSGLGACTAMTLRMYADRKGWDLQEVKVEVNYGKTYIEDANDLDNAAKRLDRFDRIVHITGDLDNGQKQRLLEIADKCPVHKTLHSEVVVTTKLG